MTTYSKQIGQRIREARRKLGLSQNDFGMPFGLHKSTVSKYELGDSSPDIELLKDLVKHYKINIEWLILGKPPIFNSSINPDIEALFLSLFSSIKGTESEPIKEYLPSDLKISVERLTEETPDNYVLLLDYMAKHKEARAAIFKYFHLFIKPAIDVRSEKENID